MKETKTLRIEKRINLHRPNVAWPVTYVDIDKRKAREEIFGELAGMAATHFKWYEWWRPLYPTRTEGDEARFRDHSELPTNYGLYTIEVEVYEYAD